MKRIGLFWNIAVSVFILLLIDSLCYSLEPITDNDYKLISPQYAPNQLIVKLKEGRSLADMQVLNMKYNISSKERVFPDIKDKPVLKSQSQISAKQVSDPHLENIYLLKTKGDIDVDLMVKEYSSNPLVEYSEPNYIYTVQMVPDDPYYATKGSWGQKFDDLYGLKPDKMNCEAAWDMSQGEGVVVAVIDTGVDYNHEDIAGNMWVNKGEIPGNGIDDDGNGYIDDTYGWDFNNGDNDPKDDNGHGTHCAGTIAAMGNNEIGIIGVAPKAKVMALKGLDGGGSGSGDRLVKCIYYAVNNGANILSNSWGGGSFSQVFMDTFHYAYNNGVVAVAAAGNSNMDTKDFNPANIDTVISVAAIDSNDLKASFSNWGDVSVAAPGVGILSLRALGTTMGTGVGANKYCVASGTSMACPNTAGVCALILGKEISLSPDQVKSILVLGVDELPDDPANDKLNCGRANVYKSLQIDTSSLCFSKIIEPASLSISDKEYLDIKISAYGEKFSYYILDYKRKTEEDWITIVPQVEMPVPEPAVIAKWDIRGLADGDYILRLRVFNSDEPALVFTSTKFITINNAGIDNLNEGCFLPTRTLTEIKGVACGFGFLNYKLEFAPKGSIVWSEKGLIYDGSTAKSNGSLLGVFDSSVIDKSGAYCLRLTVNYADSRVESEGINFSYDLSLMDGFPVKIPVKTGTIWDHLNVINNADGSKKITVSNNIEIRLIDSRGIISKIKRADMISSYYANLGGGLSIGDLKLDGKEKIINDVFLDYIPSDHNLYNKNSAYESDGSCVIGWPVSLGKAPSGYKTYFFGKSPIIDDMGGDKNPEIAMMAYKECTGVDKDGKLTETHFLFVLNSDGTLAQGWPVNVSWTTDKSRASTVGPNPAMADLNNDGKKEFLVWLPSLGLVAYTKEGQIMEGWQISDTLQYMANAGQDDIYYVTAPVIADLDNDGKYEIIIRDYNERLYVFNNFGVLIHKLQIDPAAVHDLYWDLRDEITIADLDKDNRPEIIIGLDYYYIDSNKERQSRAGKSGIHIYKYDGQHLILASSLLDFSKSNIIVGDINGDNVLEIIYAYTNQIKAVALDGKTKWNREAGARGYITNLILTDIDGDNKIELLAYDVTNIYVFAWDFEGQVVRENMPWPQEGHDPQHTGRVDKIVFPAGPVISGISPNRGEVGSEVKITGTNFGAAKGEVLFDSTEAGISLWSQTEIIVKVPSLAEGEKQVTAKVEGKASNAVTFTLITVPPSNRQPELAPIGNKSVDEGKELSFDVSARCDPDGCAVTITASPLKSWMNFDGSEFTANPGYEDSGNYGVTFIASDGELSDSEDIVITVNETNRPPAVKDMSVTTAEDTAVDIVLSGSDADGDTLNYIIVRQPEHGSLSGTAPDLRYTPEANYSGSDSFTFKANDGKLESNIAAISINIIPVSLIGDINADGTVDVIDVQLCVNVILGLIEDPDKKADVNGDNHVDVSDVQAIVNIILG